MTTITHMPRSRHLINIVRFNTGHLQSYGKNIFLVFARIWRFQTQYFLFIKMPFKKDKKCPWCPCLRGSLVTSNFKCCKCSVSPELNLFRPFNSFSFFLTRPFRVISVDVISSVFSFYQLLIHSWKVQYRNRRGFGMFLPKVFLNPAKISPFRIGWSRSWGT